MHLTSNQIFFLLELEDNKFELKISLNERIKEADHKKLKVFLLCFLVDYNKI